MRVGHRAIASKLKKVKGQVRLLRLGVNRGYLKIREIAGSWWLNWKLSDNQFDQTGAGLSVPQKEPIQK
jgi:hypothetical protein